MAISQAFRPALNKDGLGRCKYIGYEIKEGVSSKTDENGEITTGSPWSLIKLNFEVRGVARGNSKVIGISDFEYDADNAVGYTLKKLGYESPTKELVFDDEGFAVQSVDEDEEGFETSYDDDLGIEKFLETLEGEDKVFTAKVFKTEKGRQAGYWQIDYKSLKEVIATTK